MQYEHLTGRINVEIREGREAGTASKLYYSSASRHIWNDHMCKQHERFYVKVDHLHDLLREPLQILPQEQQALETRGTLAEIKAHLENGIKKGGIK